MSYRAMITSAMAGSLLFASLTVSADPPHRYGPPPSHGYGHHYPPPPPPPRYGHHHRHNDDWVAPAIIGGIGLAYLLSQTSPQTVVVERPVPSYQQRCDETTTYDRYGNRNTTRTCY